jgi:hypothetical protein
MSRASLINIPNFFLQGLIRVIEFTNRSLFAVVGYLREPNNGRTRGAIGTRNNSGNDLGGRTLGSVDILPSIMAIKQPMGAMKYASLTRRPHGCDPLEGGR